MSRVQQVSVKLKVVAVDLAGVRPSTSPSLLGLGSGWTLTKDYQCCCLVSFLVSLTES